MVPVEAHPGFNTVKMNSMMYEPTNPSVPWWYRHVRSWRARMWIETGIWIPASPARGNLAQATNIAAASMIERPHGAPGSVAGISRLGEVWHMSVPRFALPALVSAVLLGGVSFHGSVEAAGPGFIPPKPIYATSGVALVVFEGGSVDDLEAATRTAGSIGAWVQDDRGEFHVLPVGAPAFLKKRLDTAFPARVGSANFTQLRSVTLVAPD